MRFLNKYKYYNKNFLLATTFPKKRLLRFKRPKWLKIQNIFKKADKQLFYRRKYAHVKKQRRQRRRRKSHVKKQSVLLNKSLFKTRAKRFDKCRNFYKESLFLKQTILLYFNTFLPVSFFKKAIKVNQKSFLDVFKTLFFKPFFILEILFWKLKFFKSAFEAKQFLNSKQISLNSEIITDSILLKQGDIVALKGVKKIQKDNAFVFFNSFLEIDYYTNTIVVLKDLKTLNNKDLFFIFNEPLKLKRFLDYLQK